MANILILGGNGFIGINLAKQLSAKHKVYIFDAVIAKHNLIRNNNEIIYYQGSIKDYNKIISIIEVNEINIIIHLISSLIPSSSFEEYIEEYNNVILPTIRLMPLMAAKRIKFIYFSSGGTIYGITKSKHVKESDQVSPISYYGLSKQVLEDAILYENRTSNLNYLIIRPSNPYGSGQKIHGNQGLLATSIYKIFHSEKITIWGDGNVVRDYIYIEDLTHAINEIILLDVKNEIINIGSGVGHSVNEVMKLLQTLTNYPLEIEYTRGRLVDVPYLVLDISKLRSIISPRLTSLEKGLAKFTNYLKTNE